jgi:hypothetical protein
VRLTLQQTQDRREKIQVLSLAKECYSMKLNLLTNATVVDDAIRFVSRRSQDKLKSCSGNNNSGEDGKEERKEPDYDEDEDQLEENGEISHMTTTNEVF